MFLNTKTLNGMASCLLAPMGLEGAVRPENDSTLASGNVGKPLSFEDMQVDEVTLPLFPLPSREGGRGAFSSILVKPVGLIPSDAELGIGSVPFLSSISLKGKSDDASSLNMKSGDNWLVSENYGDQIEDALRRLKLRPDEAIVELTNQCEQFEYFPMRQRSAQEALSEWMSLKKELAEKFHISQARIEHSLFQLGWQYDSFTYERWLELRNWFAKKVTETQGTTGDEDVLIRTYYKVSRLFHDIESNVEKVLRYISGDDSGEIRAPASKTAARIVLSIDNMDSIDELSPEQYITYILAETLEGHPRTTLDAAAKIGVDDFIFEYYGGLALCDIPPVLVETFMKYAVGNSYDRGKRLALFILFYVAWRSVSENAEKVFGFMPIAEHVKKEIMNEVATDVARILDSETELRSKWQYILSRKNSIMMKRVLKKKFNDIAGAFLVMSRLKIDEKVDVPVFLKRVVDQIKSEGAAGKVKALEIGFGKRYGQIDALLSLGVEVTASEKDAELRRELELGHVEYVNDGALRVADENAEGAFELVIMNMPTPLEAEGIDDILQKVESVTRKNTYVIVTTDSPASYHKPFMRDPRWGEVAGTNRNIFQTQYGNPALLSPQGTRPTVTKVFKRLFK